MVAEQCLATQDDFSTLDADVPPGPGATISSFDFNIASCSSSTIIADNVDSFDYECLEDVILAVEI